MPQTFHLDGVTPSQNKLDGKHWTVKHALREEWYWKVLGAAGRKSPPEWCKRHVHIVRVSKRLIDPLNVYAGLKWLLDAFVEYGWLKDDSAKWVTISADQRKCEKGEDPHMEVTISSSE